AGPPRPGVLPEGRPARAPQGWGLRGAPRRDSARPGSGVRATVLATVQRAVADRAPRLPDSQPGASRTARGRTGGRVSGLPPRLGALTVAHRRMRMQRVSHRAEGGPMPVACPHCQSSVEQADLNAQEILCPACGSSFRLERDTTVDWASSRGPRTLGKFELIEAVGSGAFGTVYKARDPRLDRTVAIKVPRSGHLADRADLDRFLREA